MTQEQIIEGNKLIEEGYLVTKTGQVFGKKGGLLKLSTSPNGYVKLSAYSSGIQKMYLVHRLVADLYIPNPDGLPQVNHKDGNKLNNKVENLEWCTRSYNIIHGIMSGLIPAPWKGKYGYSHARSKAVLQIQPKNNIEVNEFGSAREAARNTGVSYGTISNVLIGRGKTAGGFYWKYKTTPLP